MCEGVKVCIERGCDGCGCEILPMDVFCAVTHCTSDAAVCISSIQHLRWIHEETLSLSHDHTDVGDSLSTAELSKQSFEDYQTKIAVSIWD